MAHMWEWVCPNKVIAHMWFMHDAHFGRAFLFLDILAEYTFLSKTIMVTPCLWYVVGRKLVMSYVKFPQAPFARAPFANAEVGLTTQTQNAEDEKKQRRLAVL